MLPLIRDKNHKVEKVEDNRPNNPRFQPMRSVYGWASSQSEGWAVHDPGPERHCSLFRDQSALTNEDKKGRELLRAV